ncbi:hypothetical protein POX60_24415, partial [Escherichia coli]
MSTRLSHPPDMLYMQYVRIIIHFHGGCYVIRLQLRDDALVLNDNGGRSIHFEPLLPGEAVYSRSE